MHEYAALDADRSEAFRSLARRTGRTVAEIRTAADDGQLARIIAGPRQLPRLRRAHLENRRTELRDTA